ncbi:MAG: hypothetical protein DRQ61_08510 [Gammaproteobacteria bacterium]|nr:MAG: hypothetical protein DRQ61_08510 [Gammaproteobacteria bacterium]
MKVSTRLINTVIMVPAAAISLVGGVAFASPNHGGYHNSPVTQVTQSTLNRAVSRRLLAPIRLRIDQWRATSASSGNVGSMSLAPANGMSAGDATNGLSGWASFTSGNADDDTPGLSYDSDVDTYSFGLDTQFNESLLGGVSLTIEDTEVRSDFNNGKSETDGYTIAPYIAYVIDETFSIDGSAGYSWTETDMKRNNSAVSGSQDGNSYFLSVNANATHWINSVNLTGRVGYLYSKSELDSFTESDTTRVSSSDSYLGQFQFNATAAYYTEHVMPYFSATYEKDAKLTKVVGSPNDDSGMVYSIGANVYNYGPISGGLAYTLVSDRDNIDNDSWSANIAMQF